MRELRFEGAPDNRQALGRRHGRTSQVVGAVKLVDARTHARKHARKHAEMELELTRWDVKKRIQISLRSGLGLVWLAQG